MNSQIYLIASILILAVVALLTYLAKKDKGEKRLSPLASLSFALIMMGIIFGDYRIIGYSLIGAGVACAIADIIQKQRGK